MQCLSSEYWQSVFEPFVDALGEVTQIQMLHFMGGDQVRRVRKRCFDELEVDKIATGHYTRVDAHGRLLTPVDGNRIKHTFLQVGREGRRTIFPLVICSRRSQVAREAKLLTAEKKDSYGICFIGKRNFGNLFPISGGETGRFLTVTGADMGATRAQSLYLEPGAKIDGAAAKYYCCG